MLRQLYLNKKSRLGYAKAGQGLGLPMKRKVLLFCLAVTVDLSAQQIAEIDLARHKPEKIEAQSADVGLAGCDLPHYTNSDGVILNGDSRTSLKVELTLPKETFKPGEIVDGQLLMQNVGFGPIVIPWGSDPKVINRPRDALYHECERGWLDVELKGAAKLSVPLESESESTSLYSSEPVSFRILQIEPGQWVIVRFKFLLEEKRQLSASLPLKPGKAEISVEWRQARYTWQRDGCAVETGTSTTITTKMRSL